MALSTRSKKYRFAIEYIRRPNAILAMMKAGFEVNFAYRHAKEYLSDPDVQEFVKNWYASRELTDQQLVDFAIEAARGDVDEYKRTRPDGTVYFDLDRMQKDGKLYLIEGIKQTQYGIEYKTPDRAVWTEKLYRLRGLYKDPELQSAVDEIRSLLAGEPSQTSSEHTPDE